MRVYVTVTERCYGEKIMVFRTEARANLRMEQEHKVDILKKEFVVNDNATTITLRVYETFYGNVVMSDILDEDPKTDNYVATFPILN